MRVRFFLSLLLSVFAFVLLLSCEPKRSAPAPREIASLVLVVDTSASSAKAALAELRCLELGGVVHRTLRQSQRLDVLTLATGGVATDGEPRVVVPWLRYAPTSRQFGVSASKEAQAEAFLATLLERCRSTLVVEHSSPIVAATERGALSLTGHCRELALHREVCSSRALVIISDLRETFHAGMRSHLLAVSKALRQGQRVPPRPATIASISVDGNVSVCGLAEHVAGHDDLAVSPDALTLVWRGLFDREVIFEPTCARLEPPSQRAAATNRGAP